MSTMSLKKIVPLTQMIFFVIILAYIFYLYFYAGWLQWDDPLITIFGYVNYFLGFSMLVSFILILLCLADLLRYTFGFIKNRSVRYLATNTGLNIGTMLVGLVLWILNNLLVVSY